MQRTPYIEPHRVHVFMKSVSNREMLGYIYINAPPPFIENGYLKPHPLLPVGIGDLLNALVLVGDYYRAQFQ